MNKLKKMMVSAPVLALTFVMMSVTAFAQNPDTGDKSNVALAIGLGVGALVLVVVVLVLTKKKKKKR